MFFLLSKVSRERFHFGGSGKAIPQFARASLDSGEGFG